MVLDCVITFAIGFVLGYFCCLIFALLADFGCLMRLLISVGVYLCLVCWLMLFVWVTV